MAEALLPSEEQDSGYANCDYQETSVVYVDNLNRKIGSKELYKIFCVYGKVTKCSILFNEDGRSRGCGTVHYETVDAARNCIAAFNDNQPGQYCLKVRHFSSEEIRQSCSQVNQIRFTKLHVDNLPISYNNAKLRDMFKIFGIIVTCKVMRNHFGISKGFGYIEFKYPEVAAAAIQRMDGVILENNQPMYVARFKSVAERGEEQMIRLCKQSSTICIRNLDVDITKDRLEGAFSLFGTILYSNIIVYTDRNRALGLLSYSTPQEAHRAIEVMNGKTIKNNKLFVTLSRGSKQYTSSTNNYFGVTSIVKPPVDYGLMNQTPNLYQIPSYHNMLPGQVLPQTTALPQMSIPPPMIGCQLPKRQKYVECRKSHDKY